MGGLRSDGLTALSTAAHLAADDTTDRSATHSPHRAASGQYGTCRRTNSGARHGVSIPMRHARASAQSEQTGEGKRPLTRFHMRFSRKTAG
jgi:hypothetical protein